MPFASGYEDAAKAVKQIGDVSNSEISGGLGVQSHRFAKSSFSLVQSPKSKQSPPALAECLGKKEAVLAKLCSRDWPRFRGAIASIS